MRFAALKGKMPCKCIFSNAIFKVVYANHMDQLREHKVFIGG